ncbi:MAG: universal stress protein [Acidimicrobiales bacterium]
MYKSVLVATDGSESATRAVEVATELAAKLGAKLHVAKVYRSGSGTTLRVPEMRGAYPEGVDWGSVAVSQTEAAASKARSKGVEAVALAKSGDATDEILALATRHKVDLIVVGNKGMRGAKRILGSVPNAVAHKAHCAVLIVNTT